MAYLIKMKGNKEHYNIAELYYHRNKIDKYCFRDPVLPAPLFLGKPAQATPNSDDVLLHSWLCTPQSMLSVTLFSI